jgi:hypothetical protein
VCVHAGTVVSAGDDGDVRRHGSPGQRIAGKGATSAMEFNFDHKQEVRSALEVGGLLLGAAGCCWCCWVLLGAAVIK